MGKAKDVVGLGGDGRRRGVEGLYATNLGRRPLIRICRSILPVEPQWSSSRSL